MPDSQNDTGAQDSPDAISDPILQELYRYWAGIGKPGDPPARSDLDPLDIPQLLPYIALVECYEEGRRIKFRLVGTDVAFGQDPTGKFLQDAVPAGAYGEHIAELYRIAAAGNTALYSEFAYGYTAVTGPRLIKRLFLPLSGTGEIPAMMLVGQIRDKSANVTRSAWQAGPGEIEQRKLFEIRAIPAASAETSDLRPQTRC